MADLYNAPQLLNSYCATECPIGCRREIVTEIQTLERTTLGLLDLFSQDKLSRMMSSLTSIAADGNVEPNEQKKMDEVVNYLNEIRLRIEELTLYEDKRRGNDRC